MDTMEIHGREIAYREVGHADDRPTILLIHGMAGSGVTWRRVLPDLGTHFHVIAPDLPGHGASSTDFDDYSLGAMASTLRDLLVSRGIERCTVVGQSLGGGVAMQFIYQHPEFCERLCLIGSGGLGPEVSWMLRLLSMPGSGVLLAAIAPPFARDLGNRVRGLLGRRGIRADALDENWLAYETLSTPKGRRTFLRTLRSVVDGRGQAVSATNRLTFCEQVPVLIIWGDRDPIIPVEHAHATHQAIPGSRLEIVVGAGHYPHVEAPRRVVELMTEFVESTPPGTIRLERVIAGR